MNSDLIALSKAIKADNSKCTKPCVLRYPLNFRVELTELLKYLNEYYKSVTSVNFKIPDLTNIKSNIGALTKLGVALLRMPKDMEISETTLINSVLSYTIEKKGTREKKMEKENEEKTEIKKTISNNVFAVLDNDDVDDLNITIITKSDSNLKAPNAPKKSYGSVLVPLIHTPIKLDLEESNFPSIMCNLAPVKEKKTNNNSSVTPIKLNFAMALSNAPSDEEIAKINKQKKFKSLLLEKNIIASELSEADKLYMIDEIIDFDISDDEAEVEVKYKSKLWSDMSDSDDEC